MRHTSCVIHTTQVGAQPEVGMLYKRPRQSFSYTTLRAPSKNVRQNNRIGQGTFSQIPNKRDYTSVRHTGVVTYLLFSN